MISQAAALVFLVVVLGVAGIVNLRALLRLDGSSRRTLIENMSGFRWFRLALLVFVIVILRGKQVLLLSSLLVIVVVSYGYQLMRLRELTLPAQYKKRYRLSATVAILGIAAFTGMILLVDE